jgi:hypothetical protein
MMKNLNLLLCCLVMFVVAGGYTCQAEESTPNAEEVARKQALLEEIKAQPKGHQSVVLLEISVGRRTGPKEDRVNLLPVSNQLIQMAIDERPGLKLVREHLAPFPQHDEHFLIMLVFEKQ